MLPTHLVERYVRRAAALAACTALLLAAGGARAEDEPREWPRCWGTGGTVDACRAGGNLKLALLARRPPAELVRRYPGAGIYTIDLDSDGRPDFIVEGVLTSEYDGLPKTCFVDSRLRERWCKPSTMADGFGYYWFVQLDGDPMLELFSMEGDSDLSYTFLQKLDPQTWERRDVVQVFPLIRTGDPTDPRVVCAYLWNVRDLPLERRDGKVLLQTAYARATADHEEGVFVLFTGPIAPDATSREIARAARALRLRTLREMSRMAQLPRHEY